MGLAGLVVFFIPTRLHLITLWTLITFSAFAIVYDTSDSFVYLIPAILSFSIWIGLGMDGLMQTVSLRLPGLGWIIGLLFLTYLFGLSFYNWPRVDASYDQRAEIFGREVMSVAPPRAILFTNGDRAIFTLWYFHYALHQRSDVAVIANDLLPFDWYRENLRYSYPNMQIPETTSDIWLSTIIRVNPDRRACFPSFPEIVLNCE